MYLMYQGAGYIDRAFNFPTFHRCLMFSCKLRNTTYNLKSPGVTSFGKVAASDKTIELIFGPQRRSTPEQSVGEFDHFCKCHLKEEKLDQVLKETLKFSQMFHVHMCSL